MQGLWRALVGISIGIGLSILALWLIGKIPSPIREKPERLHSRLLKKQNKRTANGEVPDFALLDHKGEFHQLSRAADSRAVVVVSFAENCPLLKENSPFLAALKKKFSPQFEFWLLDASFPEPRARLIDYGKKHPETWPILMDPAQITARALNLSYSAQSVILDPRKMKVLFRGGIGSTLENALEQIRSNKEAPKNEPSDTGGIPIAFAFEPQGQILYNRDITPIVSTSCLPCHHPQRRITPFLNSFESLQSWSAMIRETLYNDRMPPISLDPHYGQFDFDILLKPEEKRRLVQWIEDGLPREAGEPDPLSDFVPPNRARSLQGLEYLFKAEMSEPAKIPPNGKLEYLYYQLGGPAREDYWVQATWSISTNPRQLHHASLMVVPKPLDYYVQSLAKRNPKMAEKRGDGSTRPWILQAMREAEEDQDPHYMRTQTWGIGRQQPKILRPGRALFIPKGYHLVLETHYMGSGRMETEKTTIKFFGSREKKGLKQLKIKIIGDTQLRIPPFEKKVTVQSRPTRLKKDIEIQSLLGHLHMRGRAIKAIERTPGGEEKVLVSIPNYYYGWQTGTGLVPNPPIRVSAGSDLYVQCVFDNSEMNPSNPDPSREVRWGQTHDRSEMCKFNVEYLEL